MNWNLKLSTRWFLALVMAFFPVLILLVTGIIWLMEAGILWLWFLLSALFSLAALPLINKLRAETLAQDSTATAAGETWNTQGEQAWVAVEALAERVQKEHEILESWDKLWDLLLETMGNVAKVFHPKSENSILEMPVPYLLKVIELAAIDLRDSFTKNIPGSHILNINDIMRGKRLASFGKEFYNIYRVISMGVAPHTALLRETRDLISGKIMTSSSHDLKAWILRAYVEKIGYYSIELYSGSLVLDDTEFKRYTTKVSNKDLAQVHSRTQILEEEPLRILVLGQVNAGKSSLINALFGEVQALVDVVPETSRIVPYLLEHEGLQRAIIMDTIGYENSDNPFHPFKMLQQEILNTDLVILVCSAKTVARRADRLLLEEMRQFFQEHQQHHFPPVVVALTFIDHLRPFREWAPPYDLESPKRLKEIKMRQALEAVAQELSIPRSLVVPVNLKSGQIYNIEEGLIPAILSVFNETQRLKYLRCLKEYQTEEYWIQLLTQSQKTGKLILKGGQQIAENVAKQLEKLAKNLPEGKELAIHVSKQLEKLQQSLPSQAEIKENMRRQWHQLKKAWSQRHLLAETAETAKRKADEPADIQKHLD